MYHHVRVLVESHSIVPRLNIFFSAETKVTSFLFGDKGAWEDKADQNGFLLNPDRYTFEIKSKADNSTDQTTFYVVSENGTLRQHHAELRSIMPSAHSDTIPLVFEMRFMLHEHHICLRLCK